MIGRMGRLCWPQPRNRDGRGAIEMRTPSAGDVARREDAVGGLTPTSATALIGSRIQGGSKIWRHQGSTLVVLGPERCPDNPRMALDYVRRAIASLAGNSAEEFMPQASRPAARKEGVRI